MYQPKGIARCEIWGDPHYKTFDNLKYDFQGDCDYTFLIPCSVTSQDDGVVDFHLWGDNIKVCPSCDVSKLRKVYLDYMGRRYAIGQRHEVYVDEERRVPPVIDADVGVYITYSRPVTVGFYTLGLLHTTFTGEILRLF